MSKELVPGNWVEETEDHGDFTLVPVDFTAAPEDNSAKCFRTKRSEVVCRNSNYNK